MYGPNYVKLGRVFAVQCTAVSVFIVYWALYRAAPGPIRPPSAPQPCHHRLHSPRSPSPIHCNTGSGNQGMSRLSALAYPNDASIHGLTDMPLRLLSTDIGCGTRPASPLAPHKIRQHPLLATRTTAVVTKTCLGVSTPAYPNEAPIHGLADIPLRLLSTDIGCATLAPRSRLDTLHGYSRCSRLEPRQW
jgi:hypothetical protein